MRKVGKRVKTVAAAGILAACMMLGGCGKSASMWEVTMDGIKYDLSASYADICNKAISEDNVVADPFDGKIYDENGEHTETTLVQIDVDHDKMLMMRPIEDEDVKATYFLNTDPYGLFKKFESADGVSIKTDVDELPEDFVYLASWNYGGAMRQELGNYTALVVDGKYVDLSKYVEDLPDTLSKEDYVDFIEKIRHLGLVAGRAVPEVFTNSKVQYTETFVDNYEKDEAVRNAAALTYAIIDSYAKLQDGKIKNFGTISYTFDEVELNAVEYYIFTQN